MVSVHEIEAASRLTVTERTVWLQQLIVRAIDRTGLVELDNDMLDEAFGAVGEAELFCQAFGLAMKTDNDGASFRPSWLNKP